MCGISIVYRYTKLTEDDKNKLVLMNQEMAYRGPDENGMWNDEKCGLAHARLSIIGLHNGRQPILNEDKSLVLVCNGEIYNYIELKQELIRKGHLFCTDSDHETIIHLYEEYGVKCLNHLRGMFAFCLWDIKKKQLFAARDRIGEKTLYYSQIPCGVVFSTELKAILKHYIEKPQVNMQVLAESLRYNYPLNPRDTHIEQIKRVEPGQYLIVDENGAQIHFYWKRDLTPLFKGTFEDAKAETLRLMRESVNICLRSDVPVAVLLSSGIDSSSVAALTREAGREVHVITAGYKGSFDCDERKTAKRFAKEKGLIFHEVELDVADFYDYFFEYSKYIDEPVCDVSSMSQWALHKKAKELGFTVLLSGLGGDELFYGYPYWNRIADSLALKHEHQALFPYKGVSKKMLFIKFLLVHWRFVLFAGYPYSASDRAISNWVYDDYKKFAETGSFLLNDEMFAFKNIDVHSPFGEKKDGIDQIYGSLFSTFMINLCLYLTDRQGMGNAVEIRSPLIDYKLVEFVSSIPLLMKYKKERPKYFLKETLKGILPDYILCGEKRGFTPPLSYIKQIVEKYDYQFLKSESKFFNSILADRLLLLSLKKFIK